MFVLTKTKQCVAQHSGNCNHLCAKCGRGTIMGITEQISFCDSAVQQIMPELHGIDSYFLGPRMSGASCVQRSLAHTQPDTWHLFCVETATSPKTWDSMCGCSQSLASDVVLISIAVRSSEPDAQCVLGVGEWPIVQGTAASCCVP